MKLKKIFKYNLPLAFYSKDISLPRDGKILSVQIQKDQIALWVLTQNPELEVKRHFRIIATGLDFEYDYDENQVYLATLQHGNIVLHVFEELLTIT